MTETTLPQGLAPGTTVDTAVALSVPETPGVHVLVLDIVTPEAGSLMAAGFDPTLVRITVVAPR